MTPQPSIDTPQTERLRIGLVVGFHGLRGEMKVRPADPDAAWLETLTEITMEMKTAKGLVSKVFTIDAARFHGHMLLLRLEGLPDRTAAEVWRGAELYAAAKDLPDPEEGEYWANDLIGLNVLDATSGAPIGVVKDLVSSTGSEFLEVRLTGGQAPAAEPALTPDSKSATKADDVIVIPFIDRFFPDVNIQKRTITLDVPPGFLPETNPAS